MRPACPIRCVGLRTRPLRTRRLDAPHDGRLLAEAPALAKATYAPVGYLFLAEPPVESLPIPDLRTLASVRVNRPSPDLLDTV